MAHLRRLYGFILFAVITCSSTALAQTVAVGLSPFPMISVGIVNPPEVQTRLELTFPANLDGRLFSASFGWSASPCPAAVKIKFFRSSVSPFRSLPLLPSFDFVTERGPFDVTAPVTNTGIASLAVQTVALSPPVAVKAGDVIAITNLTGCGGPTYLDRSGAMPLPPGGSFAVPGDITSSIPPRTLGELRYVYVVAIGTGPVLGLLNGRFAVSLDATNPRTGATAKGIPTLLSDRSGYFSLPDFTGDATFPEVAVKMVDATGSPALGGNFWFFHSPLTDVAYTLRVRDQFTGATRTYTNGPGTPGQLCGGVDTSAFAQ